MFSFETQLYVNFNNKLVIYFAYSEIPSLNIYIRVFTLIFEILPHPLQFFTQIKIFLQKYTSQNFLNEMDVYVNLKICDWQATPAIPKDTLNRKPA